MKYNILHVFGTFTPFNKKPSRLFKDLHKLKLLTNFGLNLTTSLGEVANTVFNFQFTIPPGYEVRLTLKFVNNLADYLDLTFIIDSGGTLSTRLYDKREDFDFYIVNFPFLSSNIPSGPSYGVYVLQLIRYARCCSHYDDFRYRHKCLV